MKYQTPRGTHDLYGESVLKFQKIENVVKKLAAKYGFGEIRTPIFEQASVFERNIGEQSDIVNKEMYIFEDRSQEKMALRPEGTAPVVRALLSNGLSHKLPLKFYYMGAMFRYERPQKGRQRQFHQLGFEYLGSLDATTDVESINLAVDILKELNITAVSSYKVLINSLGSNETLNNYKLALIKYLEQQKDKLSEDSLKRLEKNPLRILDSKKMEDKIIVENAPKISDFYSKEDAEFFAKVLAGLDSLNIKYEVDYNLVRGLDYYTHTVFEIVTENLGAQGTLIAGGRYNNLVEDMGGKPTGAFGFAGGLERLALMMDSVELSEKAVAIITMAEKYNNYGLQLGQKIRQNTNYGASFILGKDTSTKLKKIDINEYPLAIILGEEEFNSKVITIKNLISFEQFKVKTEELIEFLNNIDIKIK